MDLLNQEDGIEQKRGTENFVGEGEYGYNYVSNAATNQFDRSDAEGSRENPHFQIEMQPKRESIVGYFQNLTNEQQCGVVGFLTNVVSMRSPEVSCFSTCSTPSAIERKTPLIVDKQDHSKFDDVQVNPLKLRTAEMKCLTSKDPSKMLLNKVEDLVFSQEEYFHFKGVAGLDQHKQEALKEYLLSKCSSLGINPVTPKVYTTSLQNKIGNARHTQKPKLSKV